MNEVSNLFVCLMGMGTTFVGLICIIFLVTLFANMASWSFGVNFVAEHAARKKNMPKVNTAATANAT